MRSSELDFFDVKGCGVTVEATIAVLRHANGLRALQGYLSGLELRSGVGWEQVQANLALHIENEDLTEEDLHEFVIDVHSRAHKLVSLYNVSKRTQTELWAMAKQAALEDVNDVDFPWLLDAQALEELDETPRHIYTRKTERGYELFFTSARMGHDTDDIPIEAIAPKERPNYQNAARMIVERIVRRQAFDVVFIPADSEEMVQIRVDTGNIAAKDRDAVRAHLETIVVATAGIKNVAFQPLNLFPAVRSIYDDDDAGRVTALNFNYASGSLTHKVRRTADGQKDLRKDPFHVGGVTRVNKKNMMIYFLSVELEDEGLEEPEPLVVTLPGAVRHLNGQSLQAFEVEAFASEAAIAYAVGVIFDHVNEAP